MGKPKRIIIACDGTWVNSDNGFVRDSYLPWRTTGYLQTPSNVTRFCRALLPQDEQDIQQLVYYQTGLGSAGNWYSYYIGGFLGEGFSENVREAYAFLCDNYIDGDEIYLTGFSRGAFTARSIAALIGRLGLLTKKGLSDFYPIFKDWQNQDVEGFVNPYAATYAKAVESLSFNDPKYIPTLVELGLTRPTIPIKAVAVYETVGTLGLPDLPFLPPRKTHEYSFINTEVPPNVEHAFQTLALDERRAPFSPTVWEPPAPHTPNSLVSLRQTWFAGVHSSVGGASPDQGIGDASLAWLVDALTPLGLAFSFPYLTDLFTQTTGYETAHDPRTAGYAFGAIPASTGALDILTGIATRTPGAYHATDPATGNALPRLLVGTRETVHPSVRARTTLHGLGVGTATSYAPAALRSWTLYAPGERYGGASGSAPWMPEGEERFKWVKERAGDAPLCLLEEVIAEGGCQALLLDRWPEAKAVVGKSLVPSERDPFGDRA